MRSWLPILGILVGCLSLQAHDARVRSQTAFVAAYGPSYNPSDDLLSQILAEIKGLRQDVQRLNGQQAGTEQDALAVIAKRCLSCHQSPADKGDGFVIVRPNGTLEDLSPGYRAAIVRKVQKGEMPPAGKLPDSEIKLLTEFFAAKEQK